MSLKLEDLSSLSDPSTLRRRRGCRKSVATKIDTHLETLKTKSLLVLDLDDLLSKHRQLEEAISSYEAIQSRLEVVEGPDESLRHAASVETQRASMESTKVALEKKIKHVNLANDIECLVEDITDTLDGTALGSSATQQRVKDINHTYSELNRKARSQLKDPELKVCGATYQPLSPDSISSLARPRQVQLQLQILLLHSPRPKWTSNHRLSRLHLFELNHQHLMETHFHGTVFSSCSTL